MYEINIQLKKELHNFLARKAMVQWYLRIILMNGLIILLPKYKIIPVTYNKPLLCIGFMMFSVFLIPNNLSLDLVGGEKYHRTMETLLSTPADIRKIFIAKTLFIESLGLVSLLGISIIDNLLLKLFLNRTFLDAGFSLRWLVSMYMIIAASIIVLGMLGSFVAFLVSDLKIGGYIIAAADFILVYLIVNNLKNIDEKYIVSTSVILFCTIIFLALVAILRLKKTIVMKNLK